MTVTVAFQDLLNPLAQEADALRFAIPDDWLQGRSAFGGLQAAFALKAMRELTGVAAPLRVMQTTFIAPVGGGPARWRCRPRCCAPASR